MFSVRNLTIPTAINKAFTRIDRTYLLPQLERFM